MSQVKLYVYDLSNGLAKRLSMPLTGKQIDGIWHTSVVVFGKEIFYGNGINITQPGKSHHGTPMQAVDMGETALDEDTFTEYLNGIREHYTADKYHLLDFNCNGFTNDCVGFLTGGSIPSWITDLPSDFLSTEFGRALRPTIDNMYRGSAAGAIPTPPPEAPATGSPNPQLAASFLQAVASRAAGMDPSSFPASASPSASNYLPTPSATPTPAGATVTSPIQIATNPSSFHSLLRSHRAVIAFFTSATCGPCKFIEPMFEELAHEKTQGSGAGKVAFVKVDMGVGMGGQVGAEYSVRVTPTFIMFLNGKKTHEMKGINASELKSQVDLLLFEAFPPHPHASLSLPCVEALSMDPILFKQVPTLDVVYGKLASFIDASSSNFDKQKSTELFSGSILPYIKSRFGASGKAAQKSTSAMAPLLTRWAMTTANLAANLPAAELFPLIDLWRLALLDGAVGSWCASAEQKCDPIGIFLTKAAAAAPPRNFLLTLLRMLCNAFATSALAQSILRSGNRRDDLTGFFVTNLLSEDANVRTAAASLAFNLAAWMQTRRVNQLQNAGIPTGDEDGDWEVELVSVIAEAITREENEEVVHRLVASLAFLLRLSPGYDGQLRPLLQVLQSKEALRAKSNAVVKKLEIKQLVEEVTTKLCP